MQRLEWVRVDGAWLGSHLRRQAGPKHACQAGPGLACELAALHLLDRAGFAGGGDCAGLQTCGWGCSWALPQ